jgi:hypothetical protein
MSADAAGKSGCATSPSPTTFERAGLRQEQLGERPGVVVSDPDVLSNRRVRVEESKT